MRYFRQELSSPARHMRQRPHEVPGANITRRPASRPSSLEPRATISPAMSLPRMCGKATVRPGSPPRVQRSRWLSAHARTRTSSSPGSGAGSGSSSSCSTSGPPWDRITTARTSTPPVYNPPRSGIRAQEPQEMIQAFHVHKQYDRESSALLDVTLNVEKGEFCFLTGPSGAGKTTFLKLVFREELPTQGQILVGGRNVTAIPASQIPELRRSIGVVFQDFKLLKRKTILENVAFVLRILSVPAAERRRRAFAALKAVGLHHKMHAYPLQLSGGEQQRVAIARALINEPILLLADEPTGNLDPEMAQEIMSLFQEVNSRGTTVLVATHDREMIQRLGKRVITLDRGRVVGE